MPDQTSFPSCPECTAGDHSLHRPDLGGVCVGCPCEVTS